VPRRPGRPSKRTPQVRAKILKLLSFGNYREVAAARRDSGSAHSTHGSLTTQVFGKR